MAHLADGDYHSGEALAKTLGVSRTAVWKHVAGLEEVGIAVERVRGRGYRIPGGLELLDEGRIRAGLNAGATAFLDAIHLFREIDSTNAELMRRSEPPPGCGNVVLAERQTQGRGRRGKHWVSPFARNIYLSMDWQFAGGVGEMEGLSLAVGVAVAEAIAAAGGGDVKLKWPNDVLHGGGKLGGILVELSGDAEGPCRAVVGVGLNVAMPAAAAEGVDQAWTDVAATAEGTAPGRNALAAALINSCLPLLAAYPTKGFAAWRDRWMACDAYANQPVVISSADSRIAGVARGVDERGALLLESAGQTQRISGGEVSLRVAP